MLHTLYNMQHLDTPVYGMNRGTIGFLMNEYHEDDLMARLEDAEEEVINPLAMQAMDQSGKLHEALAINEVSLLRAGPQAARLKISVDGRVRMAELVCDGRIAVHASGIDRLQLLRPWADSADWRGRSGPDTQSRRFAHAGGAVPCCRKWRKSVRCAGC